MKWKKADYIYIERMNGRKNDIQVKTQSIDERLVVHIRQTVKESKNIKCELECLDKQKTALMYRFIREEKLARKRLQKYDKKLIDFTKKFWDEKTVVVGDETLTKAWNMPNELFEIKQKILLQNVEGIVSKLGKQEKKNMSTEGRTRFLLVVDSENWMYKDVKAILWQVQKQYEDICFLPKRVRFDIEKLEDFLVEECGVVLQHLSEEETWKLKFDSIIFLVEREGRWDKSYSFGNRYMISEWEENRFQTLLFVALNDTINNSIKRCD